MSSGTSQLATRCWRCVRDLPPGALDCPECHALVHAAQLESISSEAKALEEKKDFRAAREKWLSALPLLPPAAEQAAWIQTHTRALLSSALDSEHHEKESKWAKRLGPLGPIAIVLAKSKALFAAIFKLKFLFSFFAFFGFYWALYGPRFGAGFAALILVHEMGHFIDIKRRGLPAEMPVFLPGLGAYVRWQAIGVSLETRAAVSLAGPFAGLIGSAVCLFLWWHSGDGLWAGLARAGAFLNVLNLIPIWILDGGGAVAAIGRTERLLLACLAVALWLILGEGIFFLVAAGAVWRLFTKDMPPESSRFIASYYFAVMVFFGLVLHLVPGHGFATN